MPILLLYMLKLSIGLSAVYLFYRLLLQRLTFYQANRWYLLAYPLICCIIPLIDVAPMVSAGDSTTHYVVNYIPAVQQYVAPMPNGAVAATVAPMLREPINPWTIVSTIVLAGMLFFLARLLIRLASLMRIKKQAVLMHNYDVKLYKVNGNLLPFSFADSIYVNTDAYSPGELQQIIRHEQVHVNQKHTVDIILGELLCIINWYNPFAWLLRHAMRQNLEFIADHTVVNMVGDKKDYQYLLLKVKGVPIFGVVNQLNFSSLKKRIAMMNKIKSAKQHLLKFAFALPLAAFLLLAFRSPFAGKKVQEPYKHIYAGLVYDIDTKLLLANVHIREAVSGKETYSDENGYFEFTFPIANGNYERRFVLTKEDYWHGSNTTSGSSIDGVPVRDNLSVLMEGMKKNGIKDGPGPSSSIGGIDITLDKPLYPQIKQYALESFTQTGRFHPSVMTYTPPIDTVGNWKAFLRKNPEVINVIWSIVKDEKDISPDALVAVKVSKGDEIVTVVYKNNKQSIYNIAKDGEFSRFVQDFKGPPPPAYTAPPAEAFNQ